jgi:Fe2+ or Zn2+ uptake regulation protein
MKDKEDLLKATEYYDVYTEQGRAVLKTIIAAAGQDYSAKLTISALSDLSQVSRQGVYNCMRYLIKDQFIEVVKTSGRKISLFKINPKKLNEMKEYYDTLYTAKSIIKNN